MKPLIVPRGVSRPSPSGSTGAFVAGVAAAGLAPAPGSSDDTCPETIAPLARHSANARNIHRNLWAANLWGALTKTISSLEIRRQPTTRNKPLTQSDVLPTARGSNPGPSCIVLRGTKGGKAIAGVMR